MLLVLLNILFVKGFFADFLQYFIQHCFIYRPSDSTASEDGAGIAPRIVATSALAVRRSNHWTRSHRQLSLISSILNLLCTDSMNEQQKLPFLKVSQHKYSYMHRVDRMPGILSSRPNWVRPLPHPQASDVPPLGPGGEGYTLS